MVTAKDVILHNIKNKEKKNVRSSPKKGEPIDRITKKLSKHKKKK